MYIHNIYVCIGSFGLYFEMYPWIFVFCAFQNISRCVVRMFYEQCFRIRVIYDSLSRCVYEIQFHWIQLCTLFICTYMKSTRNIHSSQLMSFAIIKHSTVLVSELIKLLLCYVGYECSKSFSILLFHWKNSLWSYESIMYCYW